MVRGYIILLLLAVSSLLRAQVPQTDFIDLGLPSRTFWSTCNVGAVLPEEAGSFFAWGETKNKQSYELESYKHFFMETGTCGNLGNIGGTRNDAATMNLGGPWRMPTLKEVKELVEQCNWKWTEVNGVGGMKVTGPNGNSIFLPATGYRWGGKLFGEEDFGYYWTDTQRGYYNLDHAWSLYFDYTGAHTCDFNFRRYHGHVVRPVCSPSDMYSLNY